MENICESLARGAKKGVVAAEAGDGGDARVADGRRYGAAKDAALDEAGRERAVETAAVVLRLFVSLTRY